jgi:hypothetical protein
MKTLNLITWKSLRDERGSVTIFQPLTIKNGTIGQIPVSVANFLTLTYWLQSYCGGSKGRKIFLAA